MMEPMSRSRHTGSGGALSEAAARPRRAVSRNKLRIHSAHGTAMWVVLVGCGVWACPRRGGGRLPGSQNACAALPWGFSL